MKPPPAAAIVRTQVYQEPMGGMVLENGRLRLLVFDPDRREVVQWTR